MEIIRKNKRELCIALFLFFIFAILMSPLIVISIKTFFIIGSLGLALIYTWFIATYILYSHKKVSKYGEMLIRVRLEEKLMKFLILPTIFYLSIIGTLYFSKSLVLNYFISSSAFILFYLTFLNIKSSYAKLYSISVSTKLIYDAILIVVFFLLSFCFASYGLQEWYLIGAEVGLSLLMFLYKLYMDELSSFTGYLVVLLSTAVVFLFGYMFLDSNIFVFPAGVTIGFYIVIALWRTRSEGSTKLEDYISPILFAIMALVLIFNM